MSRGREPGAPARRAYERPEIRVVELDVMASFPDNCKTDQGGTGFGGVAGNCLQSSQPNVMCMTLGS